MKKKRIALNLTQLEFGIKIGYDKAQFVCMMENGHSPIPISKLKIICKVLKFTKEEKHDFQLALTKEYIDKLQEAVS